MELYSYEHIAFLTDYYKINEELQSSYLRLFFMLGVNEHIFNLAVRIHQDYKQHTEKYTCLFFKTYVFSEVLPFENLGVDTIKIAPISASHVSSSCGRVKNKITIQLNDFSILTLIHELNHIFDNITAFPINSDKKFIYFHHRMKKTKYKIFTDFLYLTSNSEIKSRTAEFFTYLLVNHYIINQWNAPLARKQLNYLLRESVFYNDAMTLKNAVIENTYNEEEKLIDLISEFNYYKKQHDYRNLLVKEKKPFLRLRFFIFNMFINTRKKTVPKKEIEDFKIKYNNIFQKSGNCYLLRFNKIILNFEEVRVGKNFLITKIDIQEALLRTEERKSYSPTEIKPTVDRICTALNIH